MLSGFSPAVLEYCSAVWYSAGDIHLELLDRTFNGTCSLTGGVLDCDLAHRRSVAVLCRLMHPLGGSLHVPYVPVRVLDGALVAHRYTYAPSRCRTS